MLILWISACKINLLTAQIGSNAGTFKKNKKERKKKRCAVLPSFSLLPQFPLQSPFPFASSPLLGGYEQDYKPVMCMLPLIVPRDRIWLWVFHSKMLIYPIFYPLKGDYTPRRSMPAST